MAIQMRRGNLVNYDADKMLPGEFGVATDEKELYIAFGSGDSKRVLTEDDLVPQTVQKVWTGVCNSISTALLKVVTLDNPEGFALVDGVTICVYFSNGSKSTPLRINVENTGNQVVYYMDSDLNGNQIAPPYNYLSKGWNVFTYASNRWYRVFGDMTDISYLSTTKANLESPEFTGTPTAPTAAAGTNTTQIATTAFVQKAVSDAGKTITATDKGSGVVELSLT